MHHLGRDNARLIASLGLVLASLALAAAPVLQGLPLATTLQDFHQPGTQPNQLVHPIEESINCTGCHSGYDPDQEPYERWAASMMAQSSRDPVFHAALAIANQDAQDGGEFCLRCHTPGAWLDGRSTPSDGSALNNSLGDFDGVTCHVCHRMVDPVYDANVNPRLDTRILQALAEVPITPSNGQYVIDPTDVRRGPFDLGPNFFFHDWRQSPYHREALLCGTCHEVSNPTLSKQQDGTYQLNASNSPHPTQLKTDEFPVERTFSEWEQSAYARRPIQTVDASYPGGRFGGNRTVVSTCQDCHMPDTHGTACLPALAVAVRDDLPLHDFNGVNSWVLDAVRSTYPDSQTGLTTSSVAAAHARNDEMQHRASDVYAWIQNAQLAVRIVNQTGHKLPTGYSEGRRMWINVQFFNALNQLVAERGSYDPSMATLTSNDTKVYRGEYGIDAQQSVATGLPVGPSFHFVLNNTLFLDNRIPPRGFKSSTFAAAQSAPVGVTYEEEQYWDDTQYAIPLGATRAVVTTYHQTSSREYMEFLRDTNTTNGAGLVAYNQWLLHGKSAPVLMKSTSIDFTQPACPPPISYGAAKVLSNGRTPFFTSSGVASLSQNNFNLIVRNGLPFAQGVVKSSPTTNSVPFQGGTLFLGGSRAQVAMFQLNAQGQATIPIVITPAMVGTTINYQAFFDDANAPQMTALTNALHVSVCQ